MNEKNEGKLEDEVAGVGLAPKASEEVTMVEKKETKQKKIEPGKASSEIEAERVASRQRAHEAKVAKFQAGGEY